MKKILKSLSVAAVLLFCFSPNLLASIDNNRFDITMLCLGDAGDYCEALEVNLDEFIFGESESSFAIEDAPGLGTGSYEDRGLFIEASYAAVNLSLSKYEFEISALNIIDFMLIGTMTIDYYQWNLTGFSWNKEDEATVIFFGIVDN